MDAVVVIGGSTASGKSTLALRVAAATGGVIVNADSQQLFADLPTLTARPTPEDEAAAPHRLYGVLAADEAPSAGRWLARVETVLRELRVTARLPIVTGGSALYLDALLHGLAELPPVPPELRARLRREAAEVSPAAMHRRLAVIDPIMATRLHPGDPQRVLRALEVALATGRSLASWQAAAPRRLELPRVIGIALLPSAAVCASRIERRLEAMLADGALAEVQALIRERPGWRSLPIAKVHGMRELAARLDGTMAGAEASARITAQVRQFAKRQRTYFRNRLGALQAVDALGEEPRLVEMLLRRLAG